MLLLVAFLALGREVMTLWNEDRVENLCSAKLPVMFVARSSADRSWPMLSDEDILSANV